MGKKHNKLKPKAPRGFVSREADDIRVTDEVLQKIKAVYELYGFDPLETPIVEFSDCLGKFLPDQDRPNEGVFSFQDEDQWVSLRYDLTAPLARYVAENFSDITKPFRSYRAGYVFRNEKPGPGRFRQFMQFDADSVGTASISADAEICMMAADCMEAVDIARGDYVVRINNRKIIDGLMNNVGMSGHESELQASQLTVLRAIDKLDRIGIEGVKALLTDGRKDQSGDFTQGAGLSAERADQILAFVQATGKSNAETLENMRKILVSSEIGLEGVNELSQMEDLFKAAGYQEDRMIIDTSIVRGLEYYTGPVFEVELTFNVQNEKGQDVVFGSVAGGGRYDGLVSRFRSETVPATGFSIGVSRLMTAVKSRQKEKAGSFKGPIIVTVMDQTLMGNYQEMVSELRQNGIRSELYIGTAGFRAQMKYADKRGAMAVIIQGSEEAADNKVQIKDLALGSQMAEQINDHSEWKEGRPAQVTVDRADMLKTIQNLQKDYN